jgi:hypothetical protein
MGLTDFDEVVNLSDMILPFIIRAALNFAIFDWRAEDSKYCSSFGHGMARLSGEKFRTLEH